MKKFLVLMLILVCCGLLFVACSYDITTSKSGTIGVSIYPASDTKATLTPTATSTEKSITDDGMGLYRITYAKTGEGEVSLFTDKAQAGERVSVTATPANNWKLESISVNGQALGAGVTSFDMPEEDVALSVVFADKRHVLLCGDHIAAELTDRMDGYTEPAYEVLEGERYYFTIDYDADTCYYEDKDVNFVWYDSETSQNIPLPVFKESAGRYSVVASDKNGYVSVTLHDYRTVTLSKVFTSDYGWGIYSEEDYTNQCQVAITVDGQPYTMGAKVKDGAEFKVHMTVPFAYRVKKINGINSGFTPDQTNHDEFTFTLADRSKHYEEKDVILSIEIGKVYTVSCGEYKYGTISVHGEGLKGEVVGLKVTPLYGYTLSSIRYTTDGVNYETVDHDSYDKTFYYFRMPDGDVTVVAEFNDEDTPADYVRGTILVKYEGDASVPASDLLESVDFGYGDPVDSLAPYGKVYLPKYSHFDFSAQKTQDYLYKAVTITTDPESVLLNYAYGFVAFGDIYVGEEDFFITFELLE